MAHIREVAALAGVSAATVSNVLNGSKNVSPLLREQVLRAAQQLDYRPSAAARSLRGRSSGTVAFLVPDITIPFFAELVRAVEEAASTSECTVLVCSTGNSIAKEEAYLRMLRDRAIDGILISGVRGNLEENEALSRLAQGGFPVVMMDRPIPGLDVDSVTIDNRCASAAAAGHLASLGHTRIGFVCGDLSVGINVDRLAGYEDALAEHGLAFEPDLVREGGFEVGRGYEEGLALLAMATRPTAIMAANDMVAIGVAHAAHERGLVIPDELSLVGFDDIPLSQFLTPPLTTMAQPVAQMGRLAFATLHSRVQDPARPTATIVLQASLRARASSAAYCSGC